MWEGDGVIGGEVGEVSVGREGVNNRPPSTSREGLSAMQGCECVGGGRELTTATLGPAGRDCQGWRVGTVSYTQQ